MSEIKKDPPIIRGLHLITDILFHIRKYLRIPRRQQRQIKLSRFHLQRPGSIVRHDLKDDLFYMRRPFIVSLIPFKRDCLSHIPARQLVGSRTYGISEKVRFLHIFARQQMLRQHRHGHIVQKCHIGCRQAKDNGMIVDHTDLFHILIIGSILRTILRIHNGLYRKLHIVRRKIPAVVPLDIFLQMKGISTGCFVELPALSKPRNDFVRSVMGRQSIKKQDIDLPVLIHCRIDPGIIPTAVNKRYGFSLCTVRLRFIRILCRLPAAGRQRQGQQ